MAIEQLARCLRLTQVPSRERIDAVSALLLGGAASLLLLICEWGGHRYPWLSRPELLLAGAGAVLVVAFARRQRRSVAPFFPTRLLKQPVLRVVSFLQFATGLGMAAGTVYIVLELQLVRGETPVETGVALIPEAVGLAAGAFIGGMLLERALPLRLSVVADTAMTALALAGLATTGVRFVESIGTAIGAAVLGALFGIVVGVHGTGDPDVVMRGIDLCFAAGAGLLVVATAAATRLPVDVTGNPGRSPDEAPRRPR